MRDALNFYIHFYGFSWAPRVIRFESAAWILCFEGDSGPRPTLEIWFGRPSLKREKKRSGKRKEKYWKQKITSEGSWFQDHNIGQTARLSKAFWLIKNVPNLLKRHSILRVQMGPLNSSRVSLPHIFPQTFSVFNRRSIFILDEVDKKDWKLEVKWERDGVVGRAHFVLKSTLRA